MEVGLTAQRRLREEAERLNDVALGDMEIVGHARPLEDASAQVRVRFAITVAVSETAVPAPDRPENLRPVPTVLESVSEPPPRSRAPSPMRMVDGASALIVKPPSSPSSAPDPTVTIPPEATTRVPGKMRVPGPIAIAPPSRHCRVVFGQRTTPLPKRMLDETSVEPGSGTTTCRSANALVSARVMKPKLFRAASEGHEGSIMRRALPMAATLSPPFTSRQ